MRESRTAGRNPLLDELAARRTRVLAFTRADLADRNDDQALVGRLERNRRAKPLPSMPGTGAAWRAWYRPSPAHPSATAAPVSRER